MENDIADEIRVVGMFFQSFNALSRLLVAVAGFAG
jgi:hypothetical protein